MPSSKASSQRRNRHSDIKFVSILSLRRFSVYLRFSAFLISSSLAFLEPFPAQGAPGGTQSFQIGERLTYEITWLNILAGTAVMEVGDGGLVGNRPLAKIETTAQSSP